MVEPFHVLIIGGGIGGLTLAQGLKHAGISAAVYERDRTVNDRLQGYRIHICPTGSLALNLAADIDNPKSFRCVTLRWREMDSNFRFRVLCKGGLGR